MCVRRVCRYLRQFFIVTDRHSQHSAEICFCGVFVSSFSKQNGIVLLRCGVCSLEVLCLIERFFHAVVRSVFGC